MYQKKRLMYQVMATITAGGLCFGGTAYAAEAAEEAAVEQKAVQQPATAAIDEYAIDDIVVTAERIPTKKMDTPAVVNVVTAQEIEDNHYNDVSEAISHQDGVSVEKRSDGTDEVTINGDQRVLVLIDGRRVNNDQGVSSGRASASLAMLPSVKNIERIEVVRGGGSALYGSDAIGGVVNIITKKEHKNQTTIDMNTGSWGTHNMEISTEGSDGTLSWQVTAALHRQGNPKFKYHGENKTAGHGDSRGDDASIHLNHKFDKASSLDFSFDHRTIKRWAWENELTAYPDSYQTQIYNDVAMQYNFKQEQTTPGFLRIYQNYKSMYNSGGFTTRSLGIDYQNGWELDKNNTLIAGVEYHTSKSSNYGDGEYVLSNYDNEKISNTAVYLQDTIKLGKQWSVIPGLRMDNHNKSGTQWSPKIAVNYNASDKTQVFASWGRVFKAPTADDLYYNNGYYYGNPNLKPETGHTTTFGITHKFDKTFTANMSMYTSRLKDPITWAPIGYDWYALNLKNEKRRGFDISFTKKISKIWSVEAGYAYTHAESDYAEGYTQVYNLAGKTNRQPNAYRLGIHFKQGAWKSNITGKYITGLNTDYFLKRTAALFDFNLSYDFNKQGTIYFKINNLFNREYSVAPSLTSPGLGRFFQIGVTYSF